MAYQLKPKTFVRVGYGRNYDSGVFGSDFCHAVTQNLPVLAQQTLTPTEPWENVFNLSQGPPSLHPDTILASQPLGATGHPLLPNGVTANILPARIHLPVVDSWNAAFQQQIGGRSSIQVAYVGNKATHSYTDQSPNYNVNAPSLVGFETLLEEQQPQCHLGWRLRAPARGTLAVPLALGFIHHLDEFFVFQKLVCFYHPRLPQRSHILVYYALPQHPLALLASRHALLVSAY
jgi:hypothetical protein